MGHKKDKKIGMDQWIEDVTWILNFFLYQHADVNRDAIMFMRELYEINLLMQLGEKITKKQIEELTGFLCKFLHSSLNYQVNSDWLIEHILKVDNRIDGKRSSLVNKLHPLYSSNTQLNTLILFPEYLSSYTQGLVNLLDKNNYGYENPKFREAIQRGIMGWVNSFPKSLMQFWTEMDSTLEVSKEKFDQCFVKSKSVKVVCLKLHYQRNHYLNVGSLTDNHLQFDHKRTLKHLELFKKRIFQNQRILAQFQKLEFGMNYNFSIFGIFVFNNHSSEGMQALADEIEAIWTNSYIESQALYQEGPICTQELTAFRNYNCSPQIELISPQRLPSGVISKSSERYNEFIRKTLNYVVNSSKLFELWIASKECKNVNCSVNEPLLFKSKALKQKIEAAKKPRKRPEPIAQKFEFGLWKHYKYINLRTMEKKAIKNIEFMYGNLVDQYPLISSQEWQKLMELEAFVYLLGKWNQLPINPDRTSARLKKDDSNTDIQKLYLILFQRIDKSKQFLEYMFKDYGLIFSSSILITYIALSKIQDELYYQEFPKYSNIQMVRLCAYIRHMLDQPLGDFTKELSYHCGQVRDTKFANHVLPSLNQYIQTLYQSGKKAGTLRALIKSNQEQALRAEHEYEKYWTQKKAFAGANIFISCEVQCVHFALNFKAIDRIFKTTIDKLNKDTSIQLLAYLGCWEILGHAAQINSAKITFLFSVCERDIATEMDFIQYFMQKLNFVRRTYNDTKTESDDRVLITLTHDIFSTLSIRRIKAETSKGEEKVTISAWFHYVSQKPLYLKILIDGEIRRVIKGSSKYKVREKAKKSQLKI